MERCDTLWIRDPEAYKGKWRTLMPDCRQMRLELGCGKGGFTVNTAQAEPDVLIIAVERVPDAMVIAMERAKEMGLTNVFFVDADAARLPDYFEEGEVDLIYLNFSDPWPSNHHAKRRLTHPDFLNKYAMVLPDRGEIHFKTDNHDLFEWSLFQFPKAGFDLEQVTRNLHENGICGIMTDYEAKFHALGQTINRCVGVRKPGYVPVIKPMDARPEENEEENTEE